MDSFMDKLAQKFNAQEMIKANTLAEEKELQKAQIQASEYKEYLEQMKQLNEENAELTQKVQALIEEVRTQNATQYEKISKLADSGIKTVAELSSYVRRQTPNYFFQMTSYVNHGSLYGTCTRYMTCFT